MTETRVPPEDVGSDAAPVVEPPRALDLADLPAVCVDEGATVEEALRQLVASEVGAVAVVDREGKLRGIFTEHDAVYRVLAGHLDLDTRIRAVMTDPVARVPVDTRRRDVLTILVKSRYRHLPVCDDDGTVRGMVSASSVLRREVERLRTQLDSLESFLTADGPGG